MSNRELGCEAFQVSDQMNCRRCHLVWDMNDSDPPECKTDQEIQDDINRRGITELKRVLK